MNIKKRKSTYTTTKTTEQINSLPLQQNSKRNFQARVKLKEKKIK